MTLPAPGRLHEVVWLPGANRITDGINGHVVSAEILSPNAALTVQQKGGRVLVTTAVTEQRTARPGAFREAGTAAGPTTAPKPLTDGVLAANAQRGVPVSPCFRKMELHLGSVNPNNAGAPASTRTG